MYVVGITDRTGNKVDYNTYDLATAMHVVRCWTATCWVTLKRVN